MSVIVIRKLKFEKAINEKERLMPIKIGQSRETDNIGYKRRRQTKQKHSISQLRHEPFYKRWQVMDEPKKL